MNSKDPYAILGVSKTATQDEIKKAYRKLAKAHHPDVNPGNKGAEEKFKEVSAAFDIIGDEKRRKAFDEFGPDALRTGFDADKARKYRRWSSGQGSSADQAGQGSAFEQFGGFDDIFEQFFYGRGRQQGGPLRATPGNDVEVEMKVTLLQALRNEETEIHLPWLANKALKVRIPKGADDGDRMRLSGQGEPSANGGPAGNLFVTLKIAPHPFLRRDGNDLAMDVPVSLPEAVFGAAIEVPTLSGNVKLKVPAGSRGDEKLRLRGKGVQKPDGSAGDLYVILRVRAPEVPVEQQPKIEELRALYSNVRESLVL